MCPEFARNEGLLLAPGKEGVCRGAVEACGLDRPSFLLKKV